MDGGYRTGLEVDGETVYGLFEEGQTDDNPRLHWFVDLRCVGRSCRKGTGPTEDEFKYGVETLAITACAAETVHVHISENDRGTPGTGQVPGIRSSTASRIRATTAT